MPFLTNHLSLDGSLINTKIPKCLGQDFEYPLNMSICEYQNSYYSCYRVEKYPWFSIPLLVMARFDPISNRTFDDKHLYLENFNYCWQEKFLELPNRQYHQEDPRLFVMGDDLMLQFGDGFSVYTCKVNVNDFTASDVKIHKPPSPALTFKNIDGREKNWTPFVNSKGALNFIYSFFPFIVIDDKGKVLVNKEYDLSFFTDKYGEIRGGSPSYYHEGFYYTFTHSCFKNHQDEKVYTIACAKHTETELLEITRHPLVMGQKIVMRDKTTPCGPSAVVFVAGAIRMTDGWIISYGVNDFCNCSLVIKDQEIEFSLSEVKENKIESINGNTDLLCS